MVGTATELRFDISRLPRIEQYQGVMEPDASGQLVATDLPSDIKTVAYYLLSEESAAAAGSSLNVAGSVIPSASGRGQGLMRTELDRAVMLYSESSGQPESLYDSGRLLAKEIVGLGFRYHDGTTWAQQWDSKTDGGLPRAIEITLVLQPTYAMASRAKEPTPTPRFPTCPGDLKRRSLSLRQERPARPLPALPRPPVPRTQSKRNQTKRTQLKKPQPRTI